MKNQIGKGTVAKVCAQLVKDNHYYEQPAGEVEFKAAIDGFIDDGLTPAVTQSRIAGALGSEWMMDLAALVLARIIEHRYRERGKHPEQ